HYLNTSSVQVEELTAALNILINKDSDYSEDSDILMNFIFEYIRMIKPYTGKMKRRDRDNNVIEIKKNFQDEHEWRYIPKLNPRELPLMLIEEEEIRAEEINKIYTDSILQTRDGVLKFDVEDIRYIFVDTIQNRNRLIQFIRRKRKGRRLSSQEKDVLISKIMVYDELKEDW
ncbi:abortive infection system antitoxin AbiGi family protein, partial [Streptococcus suis]|uniref:abortive infection system antitoxin AbiGi family protein n=2 Tax=Streptococcus TaxID=1301 RepID=UPI001EDE40EA